ncbi:MAG TPA: HRDC domain-containing protein [Opitutaceae bacterium]|nr:HRDC domain-containing protein [Opitutaceae bacterium]
MISRFLPHPVRRLLGVKTKHATISGHRLIDHPDQLPALLAAIDQVGEVVMDTEADNMYRFRVRVCLLQFYVRGEVYLVDAIAPLNLGLLWPRLEKRHLVMHGSDFDLRLLHDLCGFRATSLFDTMLAAQLLGRGRIGLASLIDDNFGVKLDKDGQKANWSRRPITQKLLDYAALDVWYLPALRDILTAELRRLGRLEWMEQQCRAQIEAGTTGFAPPDENDWRIGKSERLRARGLGVLHAVWHWRQEQAERLDTPPFKVCSNELLIRLATEADQGDDDESILNGVNLGKRHERLIGSLAAAVRQGLKRDPRTLPRRAGRDPNRAPLTQAEIALLDRIKEDRDRIAAKISIDPTLIANRSQLSQIARSPRMLGEVLLPWQASLLSGAPSLKA